MRDDDTLKLSRDFLRRVLNIARPVTEVCECAACGGAFEQDSDMILHEGYGYHAECLWPVLREGKDSEK